MTNTRPTIRTQNGASSSEALLVVDLIQIGLDLLFQIGVIVNRLIDIWVGLWPSVLSLCSRPESDQHEASYGTCEYISI